MDAADVAALIAALPRYPRHLYHNLVPAHPPDRSPPLHLQPDTTLLIPSTTHTAASHARPLSPTTAAALLSLLPSPPPSPPAASLAATDVLSHRPLHGLHEAKENLSPPAQPTPLLPHSDLPWRRPRRRTMAAAGRRLSGAAAHPTSSSPLSAAAAVQLPRQSNALQQKRVEAAHSERSRTQRRQFRGLTPSTDTASPPLPVPSEDDPTPQQSEQLPTVDEAAATPSPIPPFDDLPPEVLVLPGPPSPHSASPTHAEADPAEVTPPPPPLLPSVVPSPPLLCTAPPPPPPALLSIGWVLSQVVVTPSSLDWLLFALSTLPLPPNTVQPIMAFVHHAHSLVSIARQEHTGQGGGRVASPPPIFTWASLTSILPPPPSLLTPLPSLLSPLPTSSHPPHRFTRLSSPPSPLPPSSSSSSPHPPPELPLAPLTSALLLQYERLRRYRYPTRGLHIDHLDHLLHLALHRMKGEGVGGLEGLEGYVGQLRKGLRGGGGSAGAGMVSAGLFVVMFSLLFLFPSLTPPISPTPTSPPSPSRLSLPPLLASVSAVFAALHPVGGEEGEELQALRERAEEAEWERERREVVRVREEGRRGEERERLRVRGVEREVREARLVALHPEGVRWNEMAKRGVEVPLIPMLPWPGARRVHGLRGDEVEARQRSGERGGR